MNNERLLSDEARDALIEWIFCNWPCALEDQGFVRGIFVICEDEIAATVLSERQRQHRKLLHDFSDN